MEWAIIRIRHAFVCIYICVCRCLIGLESQVALDTINLCKNFIPRIENLSHMKELTTLLLSNNNLKNADDIRHVSTLD